MAAEEAACAFCGGTAEQSALIKSGLQDSRTYICEACADACASALRTERQLREGRTSSRPAPPVGDVRLGEVKPWSEFEVDGKQHQWRADRVLVYGETQLQRLELRSEGRVLDSVELDRKEVADQSYARRVVDHLSTRKTQSISARDVASSWEGFAVGSKLYEYRTVPAMRHALARCLEVSVRAVDGGKVSKMRLPADVQPTVDDAIMTVAASQAPGSDVEVETHGN